MPLYKSPTPLIEKKGKYPDV